MKTLKLKAFVTMVAASLTLAGTIPVFGGSPASANEDKFQKDNSIIRDDIETVKYYKQHLKNLKARYQKDKDAAREEALILDKRDIAKTEADLDRHEAYLLADKRVLVKDHKLAIRDYRNEIKKDKSNLAACKNRLDKDIDNGNEAVLSADAGKVVQYQNELKYDRNHLQGQRQNLNNDLVAVNKEIQKLNSQFVAVTYSETAYSNFNNWLNK